MCIILHRVEFSKRMELCWGFYTDTGHRSKCSPYGMWQHRADYIQTLGTEVVVVVVVVVVVWWKCLDGDDGQKMV